MQAQQEMVQDSLDDIQDDQPLPFEGIEPATISLDDLMDESLQAFEAKKLEKEMRKRVATKRGTPEELANDSALLRKWSMEREWKRQANVLCFNRQLCSCGSYHTTLIGRFELHLNNRLSGATALVAVKEFELSLPKQVKYHDEAVDLCHSCADFEEEWPLEDGND